MRWADSDLGAFLQEEAVPLYSSIRIKVQLCILFFLPDQDSTQLVFQIVSLHNQSFESSHNFPDHIPAIPHQQRPPAGPTRSYKAFKPFKIPPVPANSFRQQLITQCCVTAVRLKSVTRMGTEQHALTAKKACTRCSTQKRRCDKAIPVCGLCTMYQNNPCWLVL